MPEKLLKKQRILVDALTLLLSEIERKETELLEGGGEVDSSTEETRPATA